MPDCHLQREPSMLSFRATRCVSTEWLMASACHLGLHASCYPLGLRRDAKETIQARFRLPYIGLFEVPT